MVQVNEIVDQDSLQRWLRELPFDEDENRRIAVTIAHRAILRALPIYWKAALENGAENEDNDSGLRRLSLIFRSGIIARRFFEDEVSLKLVESLSQAFPKLEPLTGISDEAKGVEAAITLAAVTTRSSVGEERRDFSQLTYEVSRQVRTANEMAPLGKMPVKTASIAWRNIKTDLEVLPESGDRVDFLPLWNKENPLQNEWQALRQALPESWTFWRDWYQDALDGIPPD